MRYLELLASIRGRFPAACVTSSGCRPFVGAGVSLLRPLPLVAPSSSSMHRRTYIPPYRPLDRTSPHPHRLKHTPPLFSVALTACVFYDALYLFFRCTGSQTHPCQRTDHDCSARSSLPCFTSADASPLRIFVWRQVLMLRCCAAGLIT